MATSIAHEIDQPLGAILNDVETAAIKDEGNGGAYRPEPSSHGL